MPKVTLLVLFVLTFNIVISQNNFTKSFYNESRPSKEHLRIDFKDDLGNEASLPISILKGKTAGPVFTMVAGVHGFEYPPIVATQQVLREIDINKLSGTLIIVPIASEGSFFKRTPFINPLDQKNLNNAFPGNKEGTITEQVAHFITENIIAVSDIFLDIHGGDAPEDLLPFICYYDNTKKPEQTALAKRLSENSGFQYVISYPYTLSDTEPAKYTFKQAVQDGKTALSIESGKLGNVQKESVDLITNGVYNMLSTMKMYSGGTGAHKNIIHKNSQDYIKSSTKGIFYSEHKAGDSVKKGDVIGHSTDEFGTTLEVYKASKDGIVLYMLATPPVNVGDTIMCISSFEEN